MEDSSPSVDTDNSEDVKIVEDSQPKKRQKSSEVWKNFTEEEPDKDGKNMKCNHCGQRYKYEGTKHGTSTFSRHMLVCKKKPKFGDVSAMFLDQDGKLKAKSKAIDPKICRDWMTKISIAHDLPLNWVEYEYMRGFMKYLNSDLKFISRNTHASDVMNMYESEKEKLKLRLNNIAGMLCFMEVWKIARLLEVNSKSQDEVVKSMSLLMQSKFDKYWEEYSEILSIGAVFDPRMKLKLLEYCYSKIDPLSSSDKIQRLKMKLYILYDEYKRKGVGVSLFKVPQSSSSSSSQVRELEFREKGGGAKRQELGRGLNLDEKELAEYKNYKGGTSDAKSLLDVYLEEAPMDEKVEIDLLMYWKDHASRFGELARMACDVLSIPITTVASESSFSIGAHVLNKYRNRLLPEKVQALICTRNWLHGYSDDSEDYEQEVNDQVKAPNVINVEEECYSSV